MNDDAEDMGHSSVVPITTGRRREVQSASSPQFTDAYEFLRAVYNARELPLHVRREAAGVAIKYEKPALATAEKTSSMDNLAELVEAARKRALQRKSKAD